MRRAAIIAAALLQVGVLAYLAGEREILVRRGTKLRLRARCAEVRESLRGAYVTLAYEIGEVPVSNCVDGLAQFLAQSKGIPYGTCVYALLETNQGAARVWALTDRRPSEGVYLRGRVVEGGPLLPVRVRYGIEAYFLPHTALTNLAGGRVEREVQPVVDVQVAVSKRGEAVVVGHE